MLFKILFIIMVSYSSSFRMNNYRSRYNYRSTKLYLYSGDTSMIHKTIIYDTNYGSEFELEMSEEERNLHKELETEEKKNLHKEEEIEKNLYKEEENVQYTKDVIKLQKYRTMYKLLKYLIDNQLSNHEKIMLLNIFKKEINNYKF